MTKNQRVENKSEKEIAFEFLQKINFLLGRIRKNNMGIMETAKNNPEKPEKNKKFVEKVLFPETGGVLSYYNGMKYPVKGFAYGDTVETVDMVKKISMGLMNGVYKTFSNKIKAALILLLVRKQMFILVKTMIKEFDVSLSRFLQADDKYCKSGREIFRVFDYLKIKYNNPIFDNLRNIICMIWEYDDAYRYTFQDILEDLDKKALKRNPAKELSRILSLITEREISVTKNKTVEETRTAWKFEKIKRLLFLLNLIPSLKRMVIDFFLELNLNEIKMDEGDRYHASFKPGYDWRYKREEEKEVVEGQNVKSEEISQQTNEDKLIPNDTK